MVRIRFPPAVSQQRTASGDRSPTANRRHDRRRTKGREEKHAGSVTQGRLRLRCGPGRAPDNHGNRNAQHNQNGAKNDKVLTCAPVVGNQAAKIRAERQRAATRFLTRRGFLRGIASSDVQNGVRMPCVDRKRHAMCSKHRGVDCTNDREWRRPVASATGLCHSRTFSRSQTQRDKGRVGNALRYLTLMGQEFCNASPVFSLRCPPHK